MLELILLEIKQIALIKLIHSVYKQAIIMFHTLKRETSIRVLQIYKKCLEPLILAFVLIAQLQVCHSLHTPPNAVADH